MKNKRFENPAGPALVVMTWVICIFLNAFYCGMPKEIQSVMMPPWVLFCAALGMHISVFWPRWMNMLDEYKQKKKRGKK